MSTIYAGTLKPHSEVALCDCCDERPGTTMVAVNGIDTWVCDTCLDIEGEE